MTKQVKIKPEEWYSMQDIVRCKMFPWATSFWSVRKVVKWDLEKNNILKAIITGAGTTTKYQFKGSNIIKFITAVEQGTAQR